MYSKHLVLNPWVTPANLISYFTGFLVSIELAPPPPYNNEQPRLNLELNMTTYF